MTEQLIETKHVGNRREIGQDFWATPEFAIKPILSYIPKGVKTIWEPTTGSGNISKVLREEGFKVVKTDLIPQDEDTKQLNYLTDEIDEEYDWCIFNPPFCKKTEFLKRAIELKKPFMFICNVNILETATRSGLFDKHRLSIINLSNRVNYEGATGKKVWFHSVWVLSDGKGKIYYEKVER